MVVKVSNRSPDEEHCDIFFRNWLNILWTYLLNYKLTMIQKEEFL